MAKEKNKELVSNIIELVNASFHGGSWHGPSVLEVTKGISPKVAAHKAGDVHRIAELIYHITSWKIFAVKRLQGDADYNIEDDKKNWGNFNVIDQFELETLMMELSLAHDELIKELEKKFDDDLFEIVPGSEYTYFTLLNGIIHHDLYHTGQMAVLKKIASKAKGSSLDDDDFGSSRYFEDEFGDNLL